MAKNNFYVTTAIDYVNARPHVGHAFEKALADAIARWKKLKGEEVFFLTGVDENAQKNVEAAEEKGVPVKEFIDKNTNLFIDLCKELNLSHNDFIRTTAKEHGLVVQEIVKKIKDNGDIYKDKYKGHYCSGCEEYKTEKDLVDGKCPEHQNKELQYREEEAYFFKLSKYEDELKEIIAKYVIPESKKNEVLNRVEDGLNDLCISRKGAKWGIDFPGDQDFKVYVWVDALINYISGLKDKEKDYWPANLHIIGKGINWFHAVIWPALLLSAGYKIPNKLLVHGYLTLSGGKISKSLGNVIDPLELLKKYSSDSVRYSLLRCNVFEDSDYSEEILIQRNNQELANKLGNLVSRVSSLAEKEGLEKCENSLIKKLKLEEIEKKMENYEIDKVLGLIFNFIDVCNEYVQEKKPWETNDKKVLYELADSIKIIGILLWPFIPETSEKISKVFNFNLDWDEIEKPLKVNKVKKVGILFNKFEEQKVNKGKKQEKVEGVKKMSEISFDEWQEVDMRVGEIVKVEDIKKADKLFKLEVSLGEKLGKRILVAGLKKNYKQKDLEGKRCVVLANLKPTKLMGIESQGMILAAVSEDNVSLIQPEKDIELGSKIQ